MNDIYNDNTYLKNNPDWHEKDAAFKADHIFKLLEKNPIQFETVAEIGCGSGEILVQLEQKWNNDLLFFGYDISKDAIEIAKRKENQKIKFEMHDIAQKEYHCFYDLLLVIDVIEHIENYFAFLEGITSKSRYTIFHIPLDMSAWTLFREQQLIESKKRVGHIHLFTEDFIKSILSDYGFIMIDQLYTPPIYEASSCKQKVIKIMRKLLFKINKKFCTKMLGGYSILLLTQNSSAIERK